MINNLISEWLTAFVICSCFVCVCYGATPMEEILKTEIYYKSPREFRDYQFKQLSVRQYGFSLLSYNRSGEITTPIVHNVDSVTFAHDYDYNRRDPTRMCPDVLVGIATYTDWSMLVPCLFTANPHKSPRTFYVHTLMLTHFVENTLPNLDPSFRFVLITSGCDYTVPRSFFADRAIRGFADASADSYWMRILNDKRVVHWFAENHDMNHPKVSTLPTGLEFRNKTDFMVDDFSSHPDRSTIIPILRRPLKFLASDKVREGQGSMADRGAVQKMCRDSPLCVVPQGLDPKNGIPHKEFLAMTVTFPFITCVHGGGIDPSPKAWEALLVGTIPIIQHSTLDDAYERFPVMFVHEWSELFGNATEVAALLESWRQKLAPYYEEGSYLRERTLERLKAQYWLEEFNAKLYATEREELYELHGHRNHSHHDSSLAVHRLRHR